MFYIFFLAIVISLIIWKPGKFTEGGIALLSLFFLILIGALGWPDIGTAIIGNELLQPFKIVVMLIALAIMSITLDDYGFFKYAAYRAIAWSKNNGLTLFRNFFILTVLITSFASNDIVILTITPIILWFAIITRINPLPYLFAVFVAANTSSLELLIGNLTNIVIGTVFQLGFLEFLLVMILPKIVVVVFQYYFLRLIFRKQISNKLLSTEKLKEVEKIIHQPLENKRQNIFAISVLIGVILISMLTDFFPIELWTVTTFGALLILASNEFGIKERLKAIPWNVVIFVLVFIIFINKLQIIGAFNFLTPLLEYGTQTLWGSVFFSSFISAIGSGIINNIPASISLSTTMYEVLILANPAIVKATAYGLVLGTNLGAFFSPVGALATILWLSLIRQKGYAFPIKKFMILGPLTATLSIIVAGSIIALEIFLFF